jgi:hypothetical protein
LYQALKILNDRECRSLQDPLGLSGYIHATQTSAQLETVKDAVKNSFARASKAVAAEAVRDFEEANRQWSIVFNGEY